MPIYPGPVSVPNPAAGQYVYLCGQGANTTVATHTNSALRLFPLLLRDQSLTIDRIGTEVTVIGDTGSRLRIGVYADNGNRYPGALLQEVGQINGDSATIQELTLALTLSPGLYWVGGALQGAATTQPTFRMVSNWTPPVQTTIGTATTNTAATVGYFQSGVTGALPATFSTTVTISAVMPRYFARVA